MDTPKLSSRDLLICGASLVAGVAIGATIATRNNSELRSPASDRVALDEVGHGRERDPMADPVNAERYLDGPRDTHFAALADAGTPDEPDPATARAERTVSTLRPLIVRINRSMGAPDQVVNGHLGYLEGWVTALLAGPPEEVRAVAAALATEMCRDGLTETTSIAYARMGGMLGEVAPEIRRGFVCMLNSDSPLVISDIVEGWRTSGYGADPALDAVGDRVPSERVRARIEAINRGEPLSPSTSEMLSEDLGGA